MVDALLGIPLSGAGILAVLINALVIFLAVVLADKFIAHNFEVKKSLILSVLAYFVAPLAGGLAVSLLGVPFFVGQYVVPLAVWVALSEVLLQGDRITKVKVGAVAFVMWAVLQQAGITAIIAAALPGLPF